MLCGVKRTTATGRMQLSAELCLIPSQLQEAEQHLCGQGPHHVRAHPMQRRNLWRAGECQPASLVGA